MKNAGRIEICIETTWTTLCDQSWDFKDAQVVCKELGYSPYGIKTKVYPHCNVNILYRCCSNI